VQRIAHFGPLIEDTGFPDRSTRTSAWDIQIYLVNKFWLDMCLFCLFDYDEIQKLWRAFPTASLLIQVLDFLT
jgi:hypothetical protein